jgi:hypothetical protein
MKINLFTSFKKYDNDNINKERIHCLTRNLKCGFNRIHLICESKEDKEYFESQVYEKLFSSVGNFYVVVAKDKISFNDFFEIINNNNNDSKNELLNIICNNNIYFNSLQPIDLFYEELDLKRSTILALSRWDVEKYENYIHYKKEDSQDAWIMYGNQNIKLDEKINFGCTGSDNRIAHELTKLGFRLINPSNVIKPLCLNNYQNKENKEVVPPPYLFVTPY